MSEDPLQHINVQAQRCQSVGLSSRALIKCFEPQVVSAHGELYPYTFVVKDCFEIRDHSTSFGAQPPVIAKGKSTAQIIQCLQAAGATLLGTANLDEFALGGVGKNKFFGDVVNPNLPSFCTGGSSSGAAASVSAKFADFALGTDWGGSVRIPAAACEVIGFKCSSMSVPREGAILYNFSHDTIGFIFREVDVGYKAWTVSSRTTRLAPASLEFRFLTREMLENCDPSIRSKYEAAISAISTHCKVTPAQEQPPFDDARSVRRGEAKKSLEELLRRYPRAVSALPEQARAILSQPQSAPDLDSAERIRAYSRSLERSSVLITPCFSEIFPVRLDSPNLVTTAAKSTYFLELANVLDSPAFVIPSHFYGIPLQFVGYPGGDGELWQVLRGLRKSLGSF